MHGLAAGSQVSAGWNLEIGMTGARSNFHRQNARATPRNVHHSFFTVLAAISICAMAPLLALINIVLTCFNSSDQEAVVRVCNEHVHVAQPPSHSDGLRGSLNQTMASPAGSALQWTMLVEQSSHHLIKRLNQVVDGQITQRVQVVA